MTTHHRVVRRDNGGEVVPVQVVEASPFLRDKTLADECAEEKRFHRRLPVGRTQLGRRGALQHNVIVRTDLLDELPQQRWRAGDIDEAQQRVVGRTRDLVAFCGAYRKGLVLTRMEQTISGRRVAMPVKDFKVGDVIRVGPRTRHDIRDPHRLTQRQPHQRIACDAVPHRGRRVVARRTEVSLTVDKRVAQRPRLGHPHQGVVDRRVAVRVIVAHRLGNGACGFRVSAVRAEAGVEHRVQHTAVHRLEAVAHLRQSAAHDHAHGVVDVAALHLVLDVDRFDPVAGRAARRQRGVSHVFLRSLELAVSTS